MRLPSLPLHALQRRSQAYEPLLFTPTKLHPPPVLQLSFPWGTRRGVLPLPKGGLVLGDKPLSPAPEEDQVQEEGQ